MTKQEILDLIQKKIAGQGNQVDSASVLPTILGGIIDLIPGGGVEEFNVTIATQGTTEGRVTTYDVTNTQDSIDAFIASVESDPTKALAVVRDGDLLIRFEQIEVSDTTVSGIAVIGSGVYSLHLNSTEAGGDSYFSFTANEPTRGLKIFTPTVAWVAETLSTGDAAQKYGLSDTVWGQFMSGEVNATPVSVTESGVAYDKILAVTEIDTDVEPALAYATGIHFGTRMTIKKTMDGNIVIAFGN